MNLERRLDRIEARKPKDIQIHFFGWADCEWKRANGLDRGEGESKTDFFSRIKNGTNEKWIWFD